MWSLSNIARNKHLKVEDANLLIRLASVGLHLESEEMKSDALWALFYCCDNDDNNLNFLIS